MDAMLDERFGRCSWFVIYDTETGATEFIPNPHKDAEEGAGQAAVELIASRKADKIISGEFGLKIKHLLDSLKIQMIVLKKQDKTIKELIDILQH